MSEPDAQPEPRPTLRIVSPGATPEEVAALVKPAPVVAVSLNNGDLDDEAEAEEFVARVSEETGLPAADPFRGSAALILEAVLDAPKTSAVGF